MKRLTAFLICFFILLFHFSIAQVPFIEWQKCLGGKNGEYAFSIERTSDGGYIAAGFTEGPDNIDVMGYHGNPYVQDVWVVKQDNGGNVQWQKCLGGFTVETGGYVHQTPDGGYVVAGSSASIDCNTSNPRGLEYWIVKLNSSGNILWQRTYGGSQNDFAYSMTLTSDGGYIIAGGTESLAGGDVMGSHGNRDCWIIKLNAAGNLLWAKCFGGSNDDEAYAVHGTSDGGCIATGYTRSSDGDVTGYHGGVDLWVVKIDNNGNIQWQKSLGGTLNEVGWSVRSTPDGGYIVAGSATSNDGDVSGNHTGIGPGSSDYWMIKLNGGGALQWQKCYGGDKNETAYSVAPTPDGGYAIFGTSDSQNGDATCNAGLTDAWLVKTNSTGNIEWQKSMGGNYIDEGFFVQPLNDGSYILAANTCSSDVAGYHPHNTVEGTCGDYWIIKLTPPTTTAPVPVVTITPPGNVCSGSSVTFTATAQLYGGTNYSYLWKRDGITDGSDSPYYTASNLTNNETISCYITNRGVCDLALFAQGNASVTVNINNATINPQITITADNTTLCNCTTVTCTATVTNPGASPVYKWKLNGMSTGSSTNVYVSNSLHNGDVIICEYSDNVSCLAITPVVSNSIQITGGSVTSPGVTINASSNSVCTGSTVTFTASSFNSGTSPSFQWKVNGVDVGTNSNSFTTSSLTDGDVVACTVFVDPAYTCTSSLSATSNDIVMAVTGKVDPSIIISASATTICIGAPVTFTSTPLNAGVNPSFQWQINGVNAGTNSSLLSTSALANGDVVSCSISTDPLFGCANFTTANSNDIIVTVTTGISPTIGINASVNDVCEGQPISFNAVVQNAGVSPSYQWKINTTSAGINSPSFTSTALKNGDQVYCLLTPGSGNCSNMQVSSNVIAMTINPVPVITIHPADTIVSPGTKLPLNVTSSIPLASYTWMPPDKLQTPLSLSPITVPLTDSLTFLFSAVSTKGCPATASASVKIIRGLYMPAAFTPNSDGKNDVFRIPPYVALKLKEFSVYDRWGNRLFTTRDINRGWDGNYKGVKADPAVYVYMIKGSDDKGEVFLKGTIVLIR